MNTIMKLKDNLTKEDVIRFKAKRSFMDINNKKHKKDLVSLLFESSGTLDRHWENLSYMRLDETIRSFLFSEYYTKPKSTEDALIEDLIKFLDRLIDDNTIIVKEKGGDYPSLLEALNHAKDLQKIVIER